MKKPQQLFLACLFFSTLFFALPFYSHQAIVLTRISSGLDDLLFRFRHGSEIPEASNIAIVSVDDESCEKLDARWPWPRTLFAELVRALTRQGARVIAFNFSFNGLENGEESTVALANAIHEHGRVVVGATLDNQRLLKPNAILLSAGASYGYLEKIVDEDYVIRRSYLARAFSGMGARWESSFPLRVKAVADEDVSTAPTVDDTLRHWAARDGQYPINFLLSEQDFKKIPAWKVLQNKVTDGSLRGKTVFVGITSSLLAEKHATPLGLLPGVLVHADEYLALASDRRLKSPPEAVIDWAAWLISLGLLLVFLSRRVWWAVLAAFAVLFLSFIAAQIALSKDWLIHPFILLAGPVLALVTGVGAELLFLFLEKRGLEKKVLHDKMTGLYTYDYLRLRLEDEWKRCVKLQLPVSVAMTDLDRFKKINDTLGHETGNRMILRAADVIRQSVRGYDVVSRYGGDEFVILLWHADLNEARAYRERLRKQYEEMAAKLEDALLKTSSISIGVASFDPKADAGNPATPQELVEKADQDLFKDKESRRKPGEPTR